MSRSAEKDLRKKLRLENQFIREVQRILGLPIPLQRRQLEIFLQGHYTRTYDVFRRNFQDRRKVQMPKFYSLSMRDYTQGEFQNRASRQADLISRNTRKILNGIQALDISPESKDSMFKFRMGVRSTRIASTETEWAAERTKLREVQFLQGGPSNAKHGKKRWDTIGDNKMRRHHEEAYGQLVDLGAAFLVGGENMMYPGDTEFGASASNIINCRCSAFYIVNKKNLTRIS
jgi:hypothetical protein